MLDLEIYCGDGRGRGGRGWGGYGSGVADVCGAKVFYLHANAVDNA